MAIYNPQRGVYTDTPDSAGAVPIQPPPSAPPNPATAAALPPSPSPNNSIRNEGPSNPNYPTPQYNTSPTYPTGNPPVVSPPPASTAGAMKLGANSYGDGTMTNTAMPGAPATSVGIPPTPAAPPTPTAPTPVAPTTPAPPPVPTASQSQVRAVDNSLAAGAATPPAQAADNSSLPKGLQLGAQTPTTPRIDVGVANPNYPAPVFNQAPASYPQPAPFNPQQVASGATTVAAPPPTLLPVGQDAAAAQSNINGYPNTYGGALPPTVTQHQDGYPNTMGSPIPPAWSRTGNSYSDGSTSMPGDLSPEQRAALGVKNAGVGYIGGGVSSADRIAQMQRDSAHIQDMAGLRAAQDQALGGHGSGVMDQLTGDQDAYKNFTEQANLRNALNQGSWSPRGGFKGNTEAVQAAMAPIADRAKLKEVSLKNQGDMRTAQLQAMATMRGQDITARTAAAEQGVQRRGQDVTAQGNQLTYGAAAQKNAYDAFKDKRQYDFEVDKYGVETANKNRDARQTAQKDLPAKMASYLPPKDGKPDMEEGAAYARGVQAIMSQRENQLEDQIRMHPDDVNAKKDLSDIRHDGVSNLSDVDARRMAKQIELTRSLSNSMTLNPVGNSLVNSDMPIQWLKPERGMTGTVYRSDRGDVINARALKEGTIAFGQGGRMNADYGDLIRAGEAHEAALKKQREQQ